MKMEDSDEKKEDEIKAIGTKKSQMVLYEN